MALNDVKEITIPEGSVKKITDSNGNIIWGSESAFPYRRLEYVDMYGKFYNSHNRPAMGFYYLDVKFDTTTPLNTTYSYGIYFGSAGPSKRLFYQGDPDHVQQRLKNNKNTVVAAYSNLSSDIVYQFRLRTYNTNNTSGTWWFALNELVSNNQIYGEFYDNSNYAMDLNELPYIYINAHAYNTSGTSATPQNVQNKGALNFKLYRYFVRETDDKSNIKSDYYPVQRKSDGAVGFYDIKTGAFSTIQNASDDSTVTTITEPIADEYWDFTI